MVKNGMKKILILLLVLLLLVPSIVACKKDAPIDDSGESTDVEQGSASETGSETSKYDVYDDLGEFDLNGRVITIAQSQEDVYKSEVAVERLTGDVVSDAIYKRNMAVGKRMNITIKNNIIKGDGYVVVNDIEAAVKGGQKTGYELILNSSYMTCSRVAMGLFNDLKKVDNLDLSKVYWSQFLNETYDIGGAQYVASGAVSTSFYRFIFVNLLNERVLADTKAGEAPDIVGAVKDGKWTMEYQTTVIKDYYTDLGAYGKDEDDLLGFVGNTGIMFDAYMSSGEVQVLKKGDDGYYTYDFDSTRATAVMDDLIALVTSSATFCFQDVNTMEEETIKKFATGTALIGAARLTDLEGQIMKTMKDEYTVLPVAKWSEDQDYYSLISDRFTAMAMPVTVTGDDIDTIGAVMEALASESYRTVTPVYFETVLRARHTSSPVKWEILTMITENVKMDACLPYTAALVLEGQPRNSIVKLWRYTAWQGYIGTPKSISSVFTQSVANNMEENLNGTNGLQTYIREQLKNA